MFTQIIEIESAINSDVNKIRRHNNARKDLAPLSGGNHFGDRFQIIFWVIAFDFLSITFCRLESGNSSPSSL